MLLNEFQSQLSCLTRVCEAFFFFVSFVRFQFDCRVVSYYYIYSNAGSSGGYKNRSMKFMLNDRETHYILPYLH